MDQRSGAELPWCSSCNVFGKADCVIGCFWVFFQSSHVSQEWKCAPKMIGLWGVFIPLFDTSSAANLHSFEFKEFEMVSSVHTVMHTFVHVVPTTSWCKSQLCPVEKRSWAFLWIHQGVTGRCQQGKRQSVSVANSLQADGSMSLTGWKIVDNGDRLLAFLAD